MATPKKSMDIVSDAWPPVNTVEAVASCPACGAVRPDKATYDGVNDLLGGTSGSWTLYTCQACRSLYLHPRPVGDGLEAAYRTYYTHHEPGPALPIGDSFVDRLIRGYLLHRFGAVSASTIPFGFYLFSIIPPLRQQLDYFFRHLPRRPGTLLDVGCGNGGFLQRAVTAGWQVSGIEPDARAVEQTRSLGLDVHLGTLDSFSNASCFDAVTLSHVIEHVPDPAAALRKVRSLLSPGGRIWIATPNPEGLGRRWYGKDWRGLEAPRHTVVLTTEALRGLLQQEGFTDICFHRRGRGARYILDASHRTAGLRQAATRRFPAWIVDISGSISPFAAEELVVTASVGRW